MLHTSSMITQQSKPHIRKTLYRDLLKHDTMMPSLIHDISLLVCCTFVMVFDHCGSGQGVVVRCTRLRSAISRNRNTRDTWRNWALRFACGFKKTCKYAASQLIRALRSARGLKKKSATYIEFDPQNTNFPKNSRLLIKY